MKPFQYKRVNSINEALNLSSSDTDYIAGGTNLVDLMKKHIAEPNALIPVNSFLPNTIQETDSNIRIGAATSNRMVAENPSILKNYPLISKALLAGASPQIRNMATSGGNLLQRTRCPYFYDTASACNKRNNGSGCSALQGSQRMSAIVGYSQSCVAVHPSDFCVALAAMDAIVVLRNSNNVEYNLPFKDFHRLAENNPEKDNTIGDHDLITEIQIPKNNFGHSVSYVKIRERDSYAFALVSVAAALELNGSTIIQARLASGGVAHKPWRWIKAEEYLKNKQATQANFKETARIIGSEIVPLKNNAFKVPLLIGAIETALLECIE